MNTTPLIKTQDWLPSIFLLIVIATTYWIYLPGIHGPTMLDDLPFLGELLNDLNSSNWKEILPKALLEKPPGRSFTMLTFALNGILHGNDLSQWKYFNVLFHLLTGIFVFLITQKLWHLSDKQKNGYTNFISLAVTAFWLLHPLQVSTVLYTVQRLAILSTLFSFAAIFAYLAGRIRVIEQKKNGWLLILTSLFICFPLAALSKENGVLVPLYLLLAEIIFLQRQAKKIDFYKVLSIITLPLIGCLLIFWFLYSDRILISYDYRNFNLSERLLTESRALVYYLSLILLPAINKMGFYHDDFAISHSLLDPYTTLLSIIVLTALLITAVVYSRKQPLISFGILVFFASQLVESTIIPLELVFEHRAYLGSFGIALALFKSLELLIKKQKLLFTCIILWISLLTFITWNLALTWADKDLLYNHILTTHPKSPRIQIEMANHAALYRNFASANKRIKELQDKKFDIVPLYFDCLKDKKIETRKINALYPNSLDFLHEYISKALIEIGNLHLNNKCNFDTNAYIQLIDRVVKNNKIIPTTKQKILIYKAYILHNANRIPQAIQTCHDAYSAYDKNPMPLFLAVEWLLEQNKIEDGKNLLLSINNKNLSYFLYKRYFYKFYKQLSLIN